MTHPSDARAHPDRAREFFESVRGILTMDQVLLAAKIGVASGVAWFVAVAAYPHVRPYFAPIAVLLIVQPTVYDSISRALQRVAGVVLGAAAAVAAGHFLSPSSWSVGLLIFVCLLLGWGTRLGPFGSIQVPVSALLIFVVGRVTPGYGGERVVETLIGSGVAVIAVLLSPSAPKSEAVIAEALIPLHRCSEILRVIGMAIAMPWTREQAETWRGEALGLVDEITAAKLAHQGHQLNARWNTRASQQRLAIERAETAIAAGELCANRTRSIARALADGAGNAHPMPALSAVLASTASAVDAFVLWVASADMVADRQRLAEAIREADEALGRTLARVEQRWGNDAEQWLTFGMVLALSQRILAEVGRPLDLSDGEPTRVS